MSNGTEPSIDNALVVPSEQIARQASASLGGHLFQAMRAASEWIQLHDDETLLVEVAEDYAVLARRALAMTQTKQELNASVTLRSDGVRKSLAALLAFREANPELRVSLAYLTTARPGKEAQSALPSGGTGIAYWNEVRRGGDLEPLRQLLLDTQTDDRVLRHVRESDEDALRATLIEPVTWLTESPALPEAKAALEARLRALGVDRTGYADDGERALPFIIYRVLETAVGENRKLTRKDFEDEWQRATTVNISISIVRDMVSKAGGGGGGGVSVANETPPPPLSPRTAPRGALVDELRGELRQTDVLWLHGSSGLGKSLLARLMAARDNGQWKFVALKDCSASEQAARVRDAIGGIGREEFAGLILDDVPVPAPEALRRWIAAACLEVAAVANGRIIATSERQPLPQVRKAFEPLRMKSRPALYLERDDVSHMVTAAGGDAETWSALIHLTCGGGHPLLVDARVAGLASKGWPPGERLGGLGIGDSPSEITDVRREVSLRLMAELSADAHQLLLRLSALIGQFDRKLVDAVTAIDPPIAHGPALFDYLVGPWIEQKNTDRYGLSPLLTAAAAALSEGARKKVHCAAIENLIKRNPFPADLLSPLIMYAMITRHMGGLMFLGQAVISSPERAAFASELYPLLFMKSGEGGLLVPEHPGVSAILRMAQVFAAVDADPPNMVPKIVDEALAEAGTHVEPLRGANTFTTLMAALGSEKSDLAPKIWMPLLRTYHEHSVAGRFPKEMTEHLASVDLGGLTAEQFFFIVRSNKVDSVSDVEELFAELDGLDPDWRHSLLTGASILFKTFPLFVQKGWSSETTPFTLDAASAEAAYARMAERAIAWGEDEIAIECVRSRAVMLDEYLDRHEEALSVLDEADKQFGGNERLVRSRATVLGTMGRHAEELELLSTLGPTYSKNEPLERMLMLRSAAISAGKLQHFRRSAELFHQAFEAASDEVPQTLEESVRPGLLTDAAVMELRDRRIADALASLVKALDVASASPSAPPSQLFAYAAITQVAQWASAGIECRPFPEDPSQNPGVCSTLKPKLDVVQADSRRLNQEWYLLTRLEVLSGVDLGIAARLLQRERADGVQAGLAVGVTATQMQRSIERGDAAAVFCLLPRYAWLSGLIAVSGGTETVAALTDQTSPNEWSQVEAVAARSAVAALIAMLIADDRLSNAFRVATQAREISPNCGMLLPEAEGQAIADRDIFSSGLAALRLLMSDEWLRAEDLLRASVELFLLLKYSCAAELNARAHSILARRWLSLAQKNRAILSNPRLSVPQIQTAAESAPGIVGIARLIEAGCLGSSLRLGKELIEILKATR